MMMKKCLLIVSILIVMIFTLFAAACNNGTAEEPVEEGDPDPLAALIQFNAPDAVYDGTSPVGGFGSGERYLLWNRKLNDHRLKAVGFVAAESRIEAKAS
jgi:hypothetical protein